MTYQAVELDALLARLQTASEPERRAWAEAAGDSRGLLRSLLERIEELATSEAGAALTGSETAVALAGLVGDPTLEAEAYGVRGMTLSYAGAFDAALEACASAMAIADAHGLRSASARARLTTVQALASLGRFDEAAEAAIAAREQFRAAGEPSMLARAEINLGAVHEMRDEPAEALACYDRAMPLVQDSPTLLAQLESNRGLALIALDAYAEAEVAFTRAVGIFEEAGANWAAAVAEENLAYLATRQGRLHDALSHFERGRVHLAEEDSPVHAARLMADEADALLRVGMAERAQAAWASAIPVMETRGLVTEAAAARVGLAAALLRLDRREEARDDLRLAAERGSASTQARALLLQAEIALADGDLDSAGAAVEDALALTADHPAEAIAAQGLAARVAIAAGDLQAAAAVVAQAMPTAERLDLAPSLADLLHLRGEIALRQGDAAGALPDLLGAIAQTERVRGALQTERHRAAWHGQRDRLFADALRAALDQSEPDVALAFAISEQARSRALLDVVGGAIDLTTAAPEHSPDQAALVARLHALRTELTWLLGHDPDAPSPTPERRERKREIERELDLLEDRLSVVRGAASVFSAPVTLAEAQSLVEPGTAVVAYADAGEELVAFVLRDGATTVVRGMVAPAALAVLSRKLRFQISRALAAGQTAVDDPRAAKMLADVRRELAALHEAVIGPVLAASDEIGRVVLAPHGAMHTLPLHAAWDGAQYLIERLEVVAIPSVSVLAQLRRPEPPEGGTPLVVGVADAAAPQIADEAVALAELLPEARLLLNEAAVADRVIGAAETASMLHFACHGRFLPENPLGSGLKLADRWLIVRDLYHLRLRASLITLSGCETGRAVIGEGDEVVGLVRGFLAAGASRLVMSLWLADDRVTEELMALLYRRYVEGATAAEALRSAQRTMLEKHPHPALWAAFMLEGVA